MRKRIELVRLVNVVAGYKACTYPLGVGGQKAGGKAETGGTLKLGTSVLNTCLMVASYVLLNQFCMFS